MNHSGINAIMMRELFLCPGELAFGYAGAVIGTLLGSCIAISLWHPRFRFGGMCHYVLPEQTDMNSPLDARYGDAAFTLMLKEFAVRGIPVCECVAKMFGGGKMFAAVASGPDVGTRNIICGQRLLASSALPVTVMNIGGNGYRRIIFDIANGEIWCKFEDAELTGPRSGNSVAWVAA